MKLSDFDYPLPEHLIAHEPPQKRSGGRMMVLPQNAERSLEHRKFKHIQEFLRPGDLLVMNNTRVMPARLYAHKETGGKVELLFLQPVDFEPAATARRWQLLTKSNRPVRDGTELLLPEGRRIRIDGRLEEMGVEATLLGDDWALPSLLERHGTMPLPPYIQSKQDHTFHHGRYQTVFAQHTGAVAAPTAGLHFTHQVLEELSQKGVQQAYVTLHVGAGTFLPVRADNVDEHKMHEERYEISEVTADLWRRTKEQGGRVVAVGTTSLRALEASAQKTGEVTAGFGSTDLFVRPGYEFKAIDGLLTNFHLPKSTLLMLVSALVGRERLLAAYHEAIQEEYRFFSYGDSMLLLPD